MEKRISGFKTITFAGLTALLLLSGCATTKPEASKNTPQQLILQNRKAEAMQEFVMPTDINAMDEDGNTVLHVAAQVDDAELISYFIFKKFINFSSQIFDFGCFCKSFINRK